MEKQIEKSMSGLVIVKKKQEIITSSHLFLSLPYFFTAEFILGYTMIEITFCMFSQLEIFMKLESLNKGIVRTLGRILNKASSISLGFPTLPPAQNLVQMAGAQAATLDVKRLLTYTGYPIITGIYIQVLLLYKYLIYLIFFPLSIFIKVPRFTIIIHFMQISFHIHCQSPHFPLPKGPSKTVPHQFSSVDNNLWLQ